MVSETLRYIKKILLYDKKKIKVYEQHVGE